MFASVDDVSGIDTILEDFAHLADTRGDARRAIRLAAAAAKIRGVSRSAIAEIAYGVVTPDEVGGGGTRLSRVEIESARHEGEAMSTAEAVAYALEAPQVETDRRLRVHALGAMQVERQGAPVRRWGGDKAGSRQAQALFAFLFDRGGAGIAKDEVTEMIWPDLEIRRGDLAFHRTLGGLRAVLDEGRPGGQSITFEGGRYRLAAELVAWSDLDAFESQLSEAMGREGQAAIEALEDARRLYRGDLFDDCPFYGESSFVEERREYLRGRLEDLLLDLGGRHAEAGDPASAGACYRQALTVNPDSPRAGRGLEQLGIREGTGTTYGAGNTATW
jgi:hypothetical protein